MKFYLAPLEGNTGYIYRQIQHACFGGFDKYFIPFISTTYHGTLKTREKKDILPEHNAGMYAVPQIMTRDAEEFLAMAHLLREEYGYEEVNLNLGCPSKTVVTKGRGAGFLAHPAELEDFFEHVFDSCEVRVSVKTRLGMETPEEFERLLEIFNRFPLEELIIHPRVQQDFYNGYPDLEAFARSLPASQNAVCYNGNIFCAGDYEKITKRFPGLSCVMLGRGVMGNPALGRELRGGGALEREELQKFHDMLYDAYCEATPGDRNVLYKMKELWFYLMPLFEDDGKYMKRIKKSERCSAYESVVRELFSHAAFAALRRGLST